MHVKLIYSLLFIGIIRFFTSCTAAYDAQAVDFSYLFHDGNSKVWMVDALQSGDRNYAPVKRQYKNIIVFYEPNKFFYTTYDKLSQLEGVKGDFYVNSEKKILEMKFSKGEIWKFSFTASGNGNKVFLTPQKGVEKKFKWELIPLPEL